MTMLLSMTIENYRSFADPAVLDMQRRSFQTNLPADGSWTTATNRIAGLYGPNASGKTTVLRSLWALQAAIARSVQSPGATQGLRDPHALHPEDETFFEVEYVDGGARYRWALTLTDEGISSEELDVVGGAGGSTRWRRLYTRTGQEIDFGRHFAVPKAGKENIRAFLKPWTLVFSAWSLVRDPGQYAGAVSWWTHRLRFTSTEGYGTDRGHLHRSIVRLMANPSWNKAAHAVLRAADIGLSSVEIREDKLSEKTVKLMRKLRDVFEEATDEESIPDFLIDEMTSDVIRNLEFTHTGSSGTFTLPEGDESRGTQMWLDLALIAVHSLVTGEVLVIDEIDSSLHPALVRFFIDLFLNEETNPAGAQLVFTSHDLTPLGNALGGRIPEEMIWLVEKRQAESSLVCLDEYKIAAKSNVEKKYLEGAFGALPIVGDDISDAITTLWNEVQGDGPP